MMFFFQKSQKKFRSCVQRSDMNETTKIKMKEKEIKKKEKNTREKKERDAIKALEEDANLETLLLLLLLVVVVYSRRRRSSFSSVSDSFPPRKTPKEENAEIGCVFEERGGGGRNTRGNDEKNACSFFFGKTKKENWERVVRCHAEIHTR